MLVTWKVQGSEFQTIEFSDPLGDINTQHKILKGSDKEASGKEVLELVERNPKVPQRVRSKKIASQNGFEFQVQHLSVGPLLVSKKVETEEKTKSTKMPWLVPAWSFKALPNEIEISYPHLF